MKIEDLLTLKRIGTGSGREVFAIQGNENLVLKVAKNFEGIASNINEWQIWNSCQFGDFYLHLKQWLCPCEQISDCGQYLVMQKTKPVGIEMAPKIVPALITDLRLDNIGLYDGRVVFHDYGLNLVLEEAIANKKAKIVKRSCWR